MKKFLVILTILSMILGVGSSFAQENELSQKVSSLADKLAFAVEGYVVGTADEVVYIDLGQDAGIVEGVKFEVVRLDKEHPFKKDERIIGYPETEVGEIEITKVRKGMSIAKITKKNMEIQKDDKVSVALYVQLAKMDCAKVISLEDSNLTESSLMKEVIFIQE